MEAAELTAPALRIVALLACMSAASAAQQEQPATQTLDEVNVTGAQERERGRGPVTILDYPNQVSVRLRDSISVQLRVEEKRPEVLFRHPSTARRLPESGGKYSGVNNRLHLELLPDRLIATERPWIRQAEYLLDANIDEADGLPAHIPFGPHAALVNLAYMGLLDGERATSIFLVNAMHPQTRMCERTMEVGEFWAAGASPYVLLGDSLNNCKDAVEGREGDLLFAAGVPAALRQAVLELHDPISSRLSNHLGSDPANTFVAWWEDSPHAGYRFEPGWSQNRLLLFNGSAWQQGLDAPQRNALRMAFMREQIERRIQTGPSGPFARSAVSYLMSLTLNDEDRTTSRWLQQELPQWISGCASRLQARAGQANLRQDVYSLECGLVLQFVYDAVARSTSTGKQSIYDTWRVLLNASFRRGNFGAQLTEFLASSSDAHRIAQGLLDGNMDWSQFADAMDAVGVKLSAVSGASPAEFNVRSLEYFQD